MIGSIPVYQETKDDFRRTCTMYIRAPTAHRWSWLCPSCKFVIWHLVRESAPVCPIPRPQLLMLSSYKPESFGDRAQYYRLWFSLVPQCPQHHMNCRVERGSAPTLREICSVLFISKLDAFIRFSPYSLIIFLQTAGSARLWQFWKHFTFLFLQHLAKRRFAPIAG